MKITLSNVVVHLIGIRHQGFYTEWRLDGIRGRNFYEEMTEEDSRDPVKVDELNARLRKRIHEYFSCMFPDVDNFRYAPYTNTEEPV